jgi:NAD-dependent DNA ligase
MVADRGNLPKRINGHKFAFTGGIPDWPRERVLYPYVKGLGGEIVRAETIAKADCLVQAEKGNGETTRKLRGAARFGVPVITEDGFWRIVSREKALNAKNGKPRRGQAQRLLR